MTERPSQAPQVDDWIGRFQSGTMSRRDSMGKRALTGLALMAIAAIIAACTPAAQSSASAAGSAAASTSASAVVPTSSAAAAAPVKLQVWKYSTPTEDPPAQVGIDRWNAANPDIQVTMNAIPYGEYVGTKLPTAFASGTGPDVFWVSGQTLLQYANADVAAPLGDLIEGVKDDYNPHSIDANTVDGKLLAIPSEVKTLALFYRKDILAAAGLTPPKTWDELLSTAKKLTTSTQSGLVVETGQNEFQTFGFYPFLWSAGADVVNADWTASGLRTDEASSAFDLYAKLISSGAAPSDVTGGSADIGHLGRGETAMQVNGIWAIGDMKANFPDVEYGVVPIPAPTGKASVGIFGGWSQMVNAKSPHLAEALKYAKGMFVDDPEYAHDWACGTLTSYSPRKTVNDGCASVFQAAGPMADMTNNVLPISRADPGYPPEIVKALGDGIQAAMFGGKTGKEAAALAADEIDAFLKTYSGPRP
jgi:multiple sugar transport system substrate-binding protein